MKCSALLGSLSVACLVGAQTPATLPNQQPKAPSPAPPQDAKAPVPSAPPPGTPPSPPQASPQASQPTPELRPVPAPGTRAPSPSKAAEKPKVKPIAGELVVPEGSEKEEVVFNFSNAHLFEIIQQVARLKGLNYTIDPALKDGVIRLFMYGKLERNSAEDVLGLALKLNGVSVVRNGDFLEFSPLAGGASRSATPLVYGTQPVDGVGESFVVTQIIPLRFLDAEAFSGFAKEFLSLDGKIATDKGRNFVIAIDYQQGIRRVLNFVELMDKQPFDQKKLALFRLKNASPDKLYKELEPILKAANVPVGTGALQILPLQSLNALLVITQTTEWLPDLKGWIDRFDESPRTEEGELFVLPLKHAKADSVYPLLTQVLRLQGGNSISKPAPTLASTAISASKAYGQSPITSFSPPGLPASNLAPPSLAAPAPVANSAPPGGPQPAGVSSGPLSPGATVTVDPDNNALLIFGTQRDFALIESAVTKLDLLPRQVLIEATIMDITLTGEFEFGFTGFLQEHFKPEDVNLNGFTGGNLSRDIRVDRPATDSAFTYSGIFANRFGLFKLVMSAKDSRTNANVISQPRLWAIDNRPARLLVQDHIPIPVNTFIPGVGTGTGSSGYSVTNVQYLDTGLNLTVTPHINGSGVIRLELQQEISNSSGSDTIGSGASAIQAPRISRRTLSTELIIQNGATVVLGGLIQQNKSETTVGLPFINRIPLLRNLFSSRRKSNQKSELVILLTPHVVGSPEDLDQVSSELKARVEHILRDSWLDKLLPPGPASPKAPKAPTPPKPVKPQEPVS